MTTQTLPKPNTQALSWFYGEHKKGTLLLDPKYQRNPIWSLGQKCFLVDSLIFGAPIPQVFINVTVSGTGRARETIYEVVDGQQRLRAVLEFMNDEYALIATTAKAYPVSEVYKPHIGKRYSELPGTLQDAIWNYQLAVQELRGWDNLQIRALFRRLNYVVERLNKQELRHSQFFGEFVNAVEGLATHPFWDEVAFFTRRDSQRMKDVEFVSELFAVLLDGIQDGQSTLDSFYADYDVVFPKKAHYVSKFKQVLASLSTLAPYLGQSRFVKKADFYALFAAVAEQNTPGKSPIDISGKVGALRDLATSVDDPQGPRGPLAEQYYSSVIEGPNKKAKRLQRTEILRKILAE